MLTYFKCNAVEYGTIKLHFLLAAKNLWLIDKSLSYETLSNFRRLGIITIVSYFVGTGLSTFKFWLASTISGYQFRICFTKRFTSWKSTASRCCNLEMGHLSCAVLVNHPWSSHYMKIQNVWLTIWPITHMPIVLEYGLFRLFLWKHLKLSQNKLTKRL